MQALSKRERERIFRLFVGEYSLKFSEIEKRTGIRSNMVAYHLERMRKDGLLTKRGDAYALTKEGERYLPFASDLAEQAPLAVILVAAVHRGRVLLVRRDKRPYKGHLSLIGGKMRFGETLEDACRRKLAPLVPESVTLCAVSSETVEEDGETKHHFHLFLVRCDVAEKCDGDWHTVRELGRLDVIPSDKWLLQHKLKERVPMERFRVQERHGDLTGFRTS